LGRRKAERFAGEDLPRALRNVGVVILLVCSGGRADKHPRAKTTLGPAKAILHRGCAAVIASPRPLDSTVPPNSLPTFMASGIGGATLMEAVLAANQSADRHFALDARNRLAVTTYGDGLPKHPASNFGSSHVLNVGAGRRAVLAMWTAKADPAARNEPVGNVSPHGRDQN